ncbi:hypothetical protein KY290_025186 [Solanum tuberosum]|uniref:Uncharacterized protein n=1 Tax=Solanum tuberosum TaxID=4113 RepID=A0ABQ7USX4_SOLTU|nr:hypothetical protein KY284_023990 [Solanum tuberosum]KAH0754916.1 hypothetical protein KY290_025186 [Solanum tuberosum]
MEGSKRATLNEVKILQLSPTWTEEALGVISRKSNLAVCNYLAKLEVNRDAITIGHPVPGLVPNHNVRAT